MANRFHNPRPQFFDSNPEVYAGGNLYFYASGTSTPLDSYSDAALTTPNANPVPLNSAGRPATDIYLSDAQYKVVLKDASGNTVWTVDPYFTSDYSAGAKFTTYAGNPNGNLAGTAGSGTVKADVVWDRTNGVLYVCTTTGDASTAVWSTNSSSIGTAAVPRPQGRLTSTSATPVLSSGVSGATTVYYTPYVGDLVPLYNGTSMLSYTFSELALALASQHTASNIYDVFVFSNSGVLTLVTGPAWSTPTAGAGARGTGAGTTQITRLNGLWVNAVQITGRNGSTTYTIGANLATYLGSLFIDGSNGQVSCLVAYGQSRKWGVWNAYNRVPVYLKAGDGTASWTYTTAAYRQSNNAAANKLTLFSGLAEDVYDLLFSASVSNTSSGVPFRVGIGYNSTTVPSATGPC